MAKAEVITKEIEVVRYDSVEVVQLELSQDEAQTLVDILARVGGTFDTRRKYSTAVLNALEEVGVDFDTDLITNDLHGEQMVFKNKDADAKTAPYTINVSGRDNRDYNADQ